MPKRTQKLSIFPASGGLQTANNPSLIPVQNLTDMNNIIFTNDGSRKTRDGLKRFDVPGSITVNKNAKYSFDFWRYDSVTGSQGNKVIKIADGKVFADGGGDGNFSDVTGTFSIPGNDNVTADVFAGLLIMAFENIALKKYDHNGNIDNLGGTPPEGSLYRTHLGYGWISGIRNNPHILRRSLAQNPQVWSGAGTESISVDDGDGDPEGITALFPSFYGDLYVAKRRSIYRVRLETTGFFSVSLVLRGVGCISHNSVVAVQNDIIFCSERGVHSLVTTEKFGDSESSFLSAPIHDIYNEQLDFSRSKQIQGTYVPALNSYIMTYPTRGSSFNRDALGFNILTGQWYPLKDLNASTLTTFINTRRKTQLMVARNDATVAILDEDTKTDPDNTPIESFFKTGIIYPFGVARSGSFKSLTVIFRPQSQGSFTVGVSLDGIDTDTFTVDQSGGDFTPLGSPFILGTAKLGRVGVVKKVVLPLSGQGEGIQLTFNRKPSGADINIGMEILGYVIEVIDSEDSGLETVQ